MTRLAVSRHSKHRNLHGSSDRERPVIHKLIPCNVRFLRFKLRPLSIAQLLGRLSPAGHRLNSKLYFQGSSAPVPPGQYHLEACVIDKSMNPNHDNASDRLQLERSRADSAVLQLRTINEIGLGDFSGSYQDRTSDPDRDSNMEKYPDLVRFLFHHYHFSPPPPPGPPNPS
jgi:hypothetical protein